MQASATVSIGTKDVWTDIHGNSDEGYQSMRYSDADWGRDLYGEEYLWIPCCNQWMPGRLVSKKQTFVAQSTCESEYVGMSEGKHEKCDGYRNC